MNGCDCARSRELLDFHIDGELSPAETADLENHLKQCEECKAAMASRIALRNRLRRAARTMSAPEGLETRVMPSKRQAVWIPLALAATLLLAIGAGLLARRPSAVMLVGLNQHIHCAVPRKYSETPEIDPRYASLLPVVEQHIGSGLHVVMVHKCELRGRLYIHAIFRNRTSLGSLLITERQTGENLSDDRIHASSSGPWNIAAFQTPTQLVYLVSNLNPTTNRAILYEMAPELQVKPYRISFNLLKTGTSYWLR